MNNQEGSNNYNQNVPPTSVSNYQVQTDYNNNQTVNYQQQVSSYQTPVQQMQYNGNYYNSTVPPKKKNVVRLIVIALAIILVLVVIALLLVTFNKKENKNPEEVNSNHTGTRTVMIYMVGSDLESKNGAATLDINEMKTSNINLSDVRVLVYAGGAKQWKNGFENNAIYELKSDGFQLVQKDTNRSMGESATLSYFLNYVKENYQSDLYDLIFWNHGAGPILGYGQDEVYNDILTLKEIKVALESSAFNSEKLEFIGFDACLMATVEVASELRNFAFYLIASQESEPGSGWNYNYLEKINRDVDTVSMGKMIIDDYFQYYESLTSAFNANFGILTLSLVELGKVEKITENVSSLFEDVEVTLSQGGYSNLVNQITKAQAFGATTGVSFDLLDLYGVSQQLEASYPEKASSLKQSIENAVIYQKSNVQTAYGLSIYYPYSSTKNLTAFLGIYSQLDFSKNYQKFLNTYSRTLLGDKIVNWDFTSVKPTITNNGENLSVTLDQSVLEHYHNSNYVIFRDMKDGYYMPVYRSSDTTLQKDGTLVANFDKKQLTVVDSKGESGWASMYEYSRTDDYVVYEVPALLLKVTNGMDSKSVMLRLKVDNGSKTGTIVGIIANTEDGLPSGRENIELSHWEYIQFFNGKYKILDQNGNYTSNWESSSTYYLSEVSTKDNYKIEFQDLEKGYDYYCLFMIQDTQGNVHTTNLIKVN